MRLALLSDAHGNSVGLAACLDRIDELGVDAIYFLGDAVGYLSAPEATLEALRDAGAICQKGNHEAMLLGELPLDAERDRVYRLAALRPHLDNRATSMLAAWPLVREMDVDGARILMSHGSPAPSLEERIHEDTPWTAGEGSRYDVAFIGHTHRPFVRQEGDVQLVNVGSCGLPRDRGDLASFVIYEGESRQARIYRVPFDVDLALKLHCEGVPREVRELFDRREAFRGEVL